MGHGNADKVILAAPGLDISAGAWQVLVLMARAAKDGREPQLYWAGLGWLEMHMASPTKNAQHQRVKRYIDELKGAGLITSTGHRRGHNLVYQLHLPHPLEPVDNGWT